MLPPGASQDGIASLLGFFFFFRLRRTTAITPQTPLWDPLPISDRSKKKFPGQIGRFSRPYLTNLELSRTFRDGFSIWCGCMCGCVIVYVWVQPWNYDMLPSNYCNVFIVIFTFVIVFCLFVCYYCCYFSYLFPAQYNSSRHPKFMSFKVTSIVNPRLLVLVYLFYSLFISSFVCCCFVVVLSTS